MGWKTKVKLKDLLELYDEEKDEIEEIKRLKPLWIERLNSYPILRSLIPSAVCCLFAIGYNIISKITTAKIVKFIVSLRYFPENLKVYFIIKRLRKSRIIK
jgi:hypothetical protein